MRIVGGGNAQYGDDRVGMSLGEQLYAPVDVSRTAQRVRRLQETHGVVAFVVRFEPADGVLHDGQHRGRVGRQFRRAHEGDAHAATQAHFGDLIVFRAEHDARQVVRTERGFCRVVQQRLTAEEAYVFSRDAL